MRLTKQRKTDLARYIIAKAIDLNRKAITAGYQAGKFDFDFFTQFITSDKTHERFPWFCVGQMSNAQTKNLFNHTISEIKFQKMMK